MLAPYTTAEQQADYETILELTRETPDGFIVGFDTFASTLVFGDSKCARACVRGGDRIRSAISVLFCCGCLVSFVSSRRS